MIGPHEFEDECTWYSYKVTARIDATGEKREQYWMGHDANHALERAAQQANGGGLLGHRQS